MSKKIKSLGGRSFKTKKPKMNDLLAQAQAAQEQMDEELKKLDDVLADKEVEATSGGGVVKVIAKGNGRIKDIEISEELADEDFDIVKDMIIAATNEVIEKVETMKEEETEKVNQKYLSGFQGMMPGF